MFTFSDDNNATFAYTVTGVSQMKPITREEFGSSMPACSWGMQSDLRLATNFQDMWWAAPAGLESGWGVDLAHRGDTIFATWFTFGFDGNPLWMVVGAKRTTANVYAGKVVTGTGPAFNAIPFDPMKVISVEVGTATLTFADGNDATFAYDVQRRITVQANNSRGLCGTRHRMSIGALSGPVNRARCPLFPRCDHAQHQVLRMGLQIRARGILNPCQARPVLALSV